MYGCNSPYGADCMPPCRQMSLMSSLELLYALILTLLITLHIHPPSTFSYFPSHLLLLLTPFLPSRMLASLSLSPSPTRSLYSDSRSLRFPSPVLNLYCLRLSFDGGQSFGGPLTPSIGGL